MNLKNIKKFVNISQNYEAKAIYSKSNSHIIYFFIKIYIKLINLNLYILKLLYKQKLIYGQYYGFGDKILFYLFNYTKIINSDKKILTISNQDFSTALIFFDRTKIVKILFYSPIRLFYFIAKKIRYDYFYNKNFSFKMERKKITRNHRNLIKKYLDNNIKKVSKNLLKMKNENYILFFIKFYQNNISNINFSNARQTSDFKKINQIIKMITKKKNKILCLGNNNDKGVEIIRKLSLGNKKIYFLKDISKNYTLIDQIYANFYSKGSIGSDSGAFIFSILLKKKVLLFDSFINNFSKFYKNHKNIKILFKKIIINGKARFLTDKKLSLIKNPKLIENTYQEINKEYKILF
jgi:hypothetical protein